MNSLLFCIIPFLSVFCYWNSLEGELCFDDMFAILYNGDTSPDSNWSRIWRNDFWGHNISSNGSHKSYRPVTISYFRLIRTYTLHRYLEDPSQFLINNASMSLVNAQFRIHFPTPPSHALSPFFAFI